MLKPIVLAHDAAEDFEWDWPPDSERVAPWLGCQYSAVLWPISSDHPYPGEEAIEIDFAVPMGVGTLLDYPSLYQSAKELIFWSRQLKRMGASASHHQLALDVFTFVGHLVSRGLESFPDIEPHSFEAIIRLWNTGAGALSGAQAEVEACLNAYEDVAQLPDHFTVVRRNGRVLARKAILRSCGFSASNGRTTKAIFDAATARLGLAFDGQAQAHPKEIEDRAGPLTKSVNGKRQSIWTFMFENRGVMNCGNFTFDPANFLHVEGRDVDESPVPPPDLGFSLHAGAYAFALREGPALLERRRELVGTFGLDGIKRSVGSRWTTTAMTTCLATWIQTGLMTARRPKELWLMQRDCLRGDDTSGWYAQIYILKNRKEWVWIPIPPSLAEAIQRLIAISPSEPSTGPLFAVRCLGTGELRRLEKYPELDAFATSVGAVDYLAENDVPSKWSWTGKQLRRYTAHLFFWGYNGSIAVISHILHHFSVGQSAAYTKLDSSTRKGWKQVEEAFKRNIARQAIDGTLGGHAGRGLIRDAKRLKDNLRKKLGDMVIIDPDDLTSGMLEVFRRKLLVFIPKAWVICSCPETEGATKRAMCRKQPGDGTPRELGPDFTKAGPTVCPGCIWAIENEVTKAYASNDRQQLKLACAGSMQGTVLGDLQEAQLFAIMEPAE